MARFRLILPKSKLGWVLAAGAVVSWVVILAMIAYVLRPTLTPGTTLGVHDWDQMETHRQLVVKAIRDFHEFPFWQPYACGGHPNWGGFESGTTVVSPWLPFYLTMTLAHAMRVEIWGSALLSAIGAWLLAGRFTRSAAARALVVVGFAVCGRWTLQIASGHTWHLGYAWTPWALYFYDRAAGIDPTRGPPRRRDVVYAALSVAMMVYDGGIYPLPETIFIIALYGVFLAAMNRSARPLLVGAACGVLALGLSAPKLLSVMEVMSKHPRLVESDETIDLGGLLDVLTSKDQDLYSEHPGISAWGWHEWGMYIGWPVVFLLLAGAIVARGTRESPLKWTGLLCFVLGLGAFDSYAPWHLLHKLPVFGSQHVPSRWMYPALLLLLVVTAAAAERVLRRTGWARGWLEVAGLLAVAWVARDVARIARQPIVHMFDTPMPNVPDSTKPFHTERHLPASLAYQMDWAPATLTAVLANVGSIDCGTFPALHNYFRDQAGHAPGLGAHGVGDPAYRGEAYVAEGAARADIVSWSPNQVTVTVHGAAPGQHLVLNQNYDPGWSANGSHALDWADQVAVTLGAADETVVFRYRPVTWWLGLALFALTLGGIAGAGVTARRRRSRPTATPS